MNKLNSDSTSKKNKVLDKGDFKNYDFKSLIDHEDVRAGRQCSIIF